MAIATQELVHTQPSPIFLGPDSVEQLFGGNPPETALIVNGLGKPLAGKGSVLKRLLDGISSGDYKRFVEETQSHPLHEALKREAAAPDFPGLLSDPLMLGILIHEAPTYLQEIQRQSPDPKHIAMYFDGAIRTMFQLKVSDIMSSEARQSGVDVSRVHFNLAVPDVEILRRATERNRPDDKNIPERLNVYYEQTLPMIMKIGTRVNPREGNVNGLIAGTDSRIKEAGVVVQHNQETGEVMVYIDGNRTKEEVLALSKMGYEESQRRILVHRMN
jgi:adenylate kinase family enzyme